MFKAKNYQKIVPKCSTFQKNTKLEKEIKLSRKLEPEFRKRRSLSTKKWCNENQEKRQEYAQKRNKINKVKRQEYNRSSKMNIATLERPVDLNISENNIVDGLGGLVNIIDNNTPMLERPVIPNTPEVIDMILDMSENSIVCEFNNHQSQEIEFKQNVPKL